MIRNLIVLMVSILLPVYSFSDVVSHSEEVKKQVRYEIRTRLPQLTDDLAAMKSPKTAEGAPENLRFQHLQRSLQTQSEFEQMPKPNTWIVVGTLAAIIVGLLVLRSYYGD